MSFSKISLQEAKKVDRFYLRYYLTVKRARELNQQIYGDLKGKDGIQFKIEHPLRVAHLTENIKNQSIEQYHMNYLIGLLHDTKQDAYDLYIQSIDKVLKDLSSYQQQLIKQYIDQLTGNRQLAKGKKKEQQINQMQSLDIIPCWIRIFDKYDNCRRFKKNSVGKSKDQLEGYYSVAWLCYDKAINKYDQIKMNIPIEVKNFYDQIEKQLGGRQNIYKKVDWYLKLKG